MTTTFASRAFWRALIAATGFVAMSTAGYAAGGPEITVAQGTLQGIVKDGIVQFDGVRYAQPPVADLRWMPPVPVPAATGFVDASKPGAGCAQGASPWGTPSTAEDCLFLNITAPGSGSDMGFWQNKPVLVFFHGGGFTGGSGDVYNAEAMVKENDVIVVTINYRLGALGMLAHPALDAENHVSANYGLMDQQAALKWVQNNIASFGGNPQNVTVFAESAGAIALYAHLVSPLSDNLFQKVIMESSAPADISLVTAESQGSTLAKKLGCGTDVSPSAAACLRAAPVADIIKNQALPLAIIVDGKLLPAPVKDLVASGDFHRVPIMLGSNHDEGNLFAAFIWDLSGAPLAADKMDDALAIAGGFIPRVGWTAAYYPLIKKAYDIGKYASPDLAISQVMTDGVVSCPTYEMNKLFAKHAPVFEYEMADVNARSIVAGPVSFPYRAAHFSELQYLFDLSPMTIKGTPPMTDAQKALGKQMRAYWASFARNGNPNGPGLPQWPAFSPKGGPVMSLNTPQSVASTSYGAYHQCDFWSGVERM